MRRSVTLFLHLLVHILIAILIFGIIRAVASLLWDFTDRIVSVGVPIFIAAIFYLISVFLVATDLVCIAFFVSVEVWISRGKFGSAERGRVIVDDRIEIGSLEQAWEAFREDCRYSVNLYFAPVRAVIGEFERAITCGWDNQGPHLQPPGGESGADDDRATRGFSAGL